MTPWFYADSHRQRQGPVEQAVLVERFHAGLIALDALVWREGMGNWQPLADFATELGLRERPSAMDLRPLAADAPALATAAVSQPNVDVDVEVEPLPVASSGRAVFTASEPSYQAPARVATAVAAHEPATDSPYASPTAAVAGYYAAVVSGDRVVYAGFWKRTAANFIDSLIIGIVGAVLGGIVGGIMGSAFGFNGGLGSRGVPVQIVTHLVAMVVTAFYYAWFHSSANLATLGKMAIGIKVVRSHGEPISFLRGIGRYFGFVLSSLLLCIGLVMAAFTERKRALHDLMCDTVVVDKWAFTRHPERQREELGTVTWVVLIVGGLLIALVIGVILLGLFALMGAVR